MPAGARSCGADVQPRHCGGLPSFALLGFRVDSTRHAFRFLRPVHGGIHDLDPLWSLSALARKMFDRPVSARRRGMGSMPANFMFGSVSEKTSRGTRKTQQRNRARTRQGIELAAPRQASALFKNNCRRSHYRSRRDSFPRRSRPTAPLWAAPNLCASRISS